MKGRMSAVFAVSLSLLATSQPVDADDHALFAEETAQCRVTGERTPRWRSLRLRLTRSDDTYVPCDLTEDETVNAVDRLFTTLRETGDTVQYDSLAVGRVLNYVWLGRHLVQAAQSDAAWSVDEGRPTDGTTLNEYVDGLLSRPVVLDAMNRALRGSGYRATDASCEKILISGPGTAPSQPDWVPRDARVPFDAMCWFVLTVK